VPLTWKGEAVPRWYGAAAARALKRRRGAMGPVPPAPEVGPPRPLGRGLFLFFEMRSSRDMSRAADILPVLSRARAAAAAAAGVPGPGSAAAAARVQGRRGRVEADGRGRDATNFQWAAVSGGIVCGVFGLGPQSSFGPIWVSPVTIQNRPS
jgi:hypothetical protein